MDAIIAMSMSTTTTITTPLSVPAPAPAAVIVQQTVDTLTTPTLNLFRINKGGENKWNFNTTERVVQKHKQSQSQTQVKIKSSQDVPNSYYERK